MKLILNFLKQLSSLYVYLISPRSMQIEIKHKLPVLKKLRGDLLFLADVMVS